MVSRNLLLDTLVRNHQDLFSLAQVYVTLCCMRPDTIQMLTLCTGSTSELRTGHQRRLKSAYRQSRSDYTCVRCCYPETLHCSIRLYRLSNRATVLFAYMVAQVRTSAERAAALTVSHESGLTRRTSMHIAAIRKYSMFLLIIDLRPAPTANNTFVEQMVFVNSRDQAAWEISHALREYSSVITRQVPQPPASRMGILIARCVQKRCPSRMWPHRSGTRS